MSPGVTLALVVTAVLAAGARWSRSRVRFRLVPPALGLGLIGLVLRGSGVLPGSAEDYAEIGYHLFGISFAAVGLTRPEGSFPDRRLGAVWMGATQWATFSAQAAVAGLVALTWPSDAVPAGAGLGFLVPMGLNEGPGQALAIGRVWDDAGLVDAPVIGAVVATLGFVVAYGLGGLIAGRVAGDRTRVDDRTGGPAAGIAGCRSWRRLLRTAAAAAAVYAGTYWTVTTAAGLAGPDLVSLLEGVMFFLALLVAMAVRGWVIPDPADRPAMVDTTTLSVDAMTIAIIASLTWGAVSSVLAPMLAMVVAGVMASVVVIGWSSRFLTDWRRERALTLFGTVTGTAASGLALLSFVDPDQESPVAQELGASVIVSAPVILGGIALTTAHVVGGLASEVVITAFVVMAVVSLAVVATVTRGSSPPIDGGSRDPGGRR